MPQVFARFCQTLAVLCLAKLDAGSPDSNAPGSPECLGNSSEAAGMYAISLLRLASAAASTILPEDANLSSLVLTKTASYLLHINSIYFRQLTSINWLLLMDVFKTVWTLRL